MTTTSTPPTAEPQVFPPTLREVMLRPRWIGMLLLCLVVAGIFAWLGQWQLGRALQTPDVDPGATEQVQPIDAIVQPGDYLAEPLVGQRVSVSGSWVPDDFIVVSSRFNDNVQGYWVTGQLRLTDASSGLTGKPVSLAVAVGWTDSLETAQAAASALQDQTTANPAAVVDLTGRLIADEGPLVPPHADPLQLTRMSPAALLGRWHDIDGLSVYRPYLTSAVPLAGLTAISSPAPDEGGVNWLNIFYAIEWAVFAGFAFYLWYRLARDAWEKEVEALADEAEAEGSEARG
jgi:surfeit locus 1 family protein